MEVQPAPYPAFDACTYAFDIVVPVIPVDAKHFWTPYNGGTIWTGNPDAARPDPSNCALYPALNWAGGSIVDGWTAGLDAVGLKQAFGALYETFIPNWTPGWVNVFQWVLTLLGWLFATIAVAGLTGLMRGREKGKD
jgi:hypothetical protein